MSKYGLNDPRPLGQEEPKKLKCEECGMEFSDQDKFEEDEDPGLDYLNISGCGKCMDCLE